MVKDMDEAKVLVQEAEVEDELNLKKGEVKMVKMLNWFRK